MTTDRLGKYADLEARREAAQLGGGLDRIKKQEDAGKLTARARLSALLDPDSFQELGAFVRHQTHHFGLEKQRPYGDGVVTGYGTIHGRLVYVYSQDFTVFGGSLSYTHARKIVNVQRLARQNGAPIIGLNDSGGARIQEGVHALGGYAEIFLENSLASGVIPQISVIMGPCAGGAVYSPALTDIIAMVEDTSYMFVTGPNVVKTVTHEEVSFEALGGAQTHAARSGTAHFTAPDDLSVLDRVRTLLTYLPQSALDHPEAVEVSADEHGPVPMLDDVVPEASHAPYDMHEVVRNVVDVDSFFELQPVYAANIITGLARLDGQSVGVVANQPQVLAGVLDIFKPQTLTIIGILTLLVVYVTMVYGPIAAALVELFPTRIRYTSMSLPYHIGNGWFGGLLPATAFALVAQTGDIYYGLWYPIVFALITFVIGLLFVPETKDRDIYADD
ncbi:MAG: hypothetical protein EB075_03805 [Bacteroidetes bacterium]|nr:hypothetical protein [Bacteroidota bacterium]